MTRSRPLPCVCAALALVVSAGCAQVPRAAAAQAGTVPAASEEWASICSEIEALNREMESALRRGDPLAVARFYADDAMLLGPRGDRTRGREAIDRYWARFRTVKDWKLSIERLGGDRETVYQIGRSRLVTEENGRDAVHEVEFVVVWRRQPDGGYRIEVDIYH